MKILYRKILLIVVATLWPFNCLFSQDTITSFPWNEDFDVPNFDSLYNDSWVLSPGWELYTNTMYDDWGNWIGFNDEDGNLIMSIITLITNVGTIGYGTNDFYMITPPILIPTNNVQCPKLLLTYGGSVIAVVSTDGGQTYTDTIYTSDAFYSGMIIRRSVPLLQYAGQTIRVKLINTRFCYFDQVGVGYDTNLRVNIKVPTRAIADSTILCTAYLRYGDTTGLSYIWHTSEASTITTNALGDSAWITFNSISDDYNSMVSVVVTNTYNSDTSSASIKVIDCSPANTLPWRETFSEGIVCWYKPDGSNWIDGTWYNHEEYRALTSLCYGITTPQWIMSKEIHIPNDTNLMVNLFWDVASGESGYIHNYGIWVSNSGDYMDTSNYELLYLDTFSHINFTDYEYYQISLNAYAGDTIHLAFRNMPGLRYNHATLYIDNVTVRSIALPMVDINVPTDIYTGDPVVNASATILEGSPIGLSFSWHSTFYDTVVADLSFPLDYSSPGIDTLTFIIANAFGSDTIISVVQIHDCPTHTSLPFEEMFELEDTLMCWRNWNFIPNASQRNWRKGVLDNRSVIMTGPEYDYYYGDVFVQYNSWLITPAIYVPYEADGLNLELDVKGYYLTILLSTSGGSRPEYFTDTLYRGYQYGDWNRLHISLDEYADQIINIAFVNQGNASQLNIDSLTIDYTLQPKASISYDSFFIGEEVEFIAGTYNCVRDSIGFLWHSSLLDTTFFSVNDTLALVYMTAGIDTMTLVVSNLYGSDTAVAVFDVQAHPLPDVTISAPLRAMVNDTVVLAARINDCSRSGLTYSWHSSLLEQSFYDTVWSVTYPVGGMDTVTFIVSNIFGSDTAIAFYYLFDCGSAALPYYETFEGVPTAGWNISGYLPQCWTALSNGTNGSSFPHVLGSFPWNITLNSNALCMRAGTDSGLDTVVYSILPKFNRPLQELSLSLDYCFESSTAGCFIVGSYNDSLSSFTPWDTLTPCSSVFSRDTVVFTNSPADSSDRIAFKYSRNGSWFSVFVDNIAVVGLPKVTINGPSTVPVGDMVSYTYSTLCLPDSITSSEWHSTLYSYGLANMQINDRSLDIAYNSEGIDTLSFTITSANDTLTTIHIVNVIDMSPRVSISLDDSIPISETTVVTVDYIHYDFLDYSVRYYSYLAEQGLADLVQSGDTARILYRSVGLDSVVAVVENYYGIDTVWGIIRVYDIVEDTVRYSVTANVVLLDNDDIPASLNILGTGLYDDGSTATLTASCPEDIAFLYWITPMGDTVESNPYSFVVNSNVELAAVFQQLQNIGISQLSILNSQFKVYPNPASESVTIEASQPGTLTIIDQLGLLRGTFQLRQGRNAIDTSTLTQGHYFLHLLSSTHSIITKLIIIH